MKQFIGYSAKGNLHEALRGLMDPKFIILCVTDKSHLKEYAQELEEAFPMVPSIGCVGKGYSGNTVVEEGLIVTAFTGEVSAVNGVLTHVTTMPMRDVLEFEKQVKKAEVKKDQTVCIDFCSGNDEMVLTTISSVLAKYHIQLTGGTAWEGLVCCNGIVYEDACVYGIITNQLGKVKVYKENLYERTDMSYLVTKANPEENIIKELDGKPCDKVYQQALRIDVKDIEEQTFLNPLGRKIGGETYIISVKERAENGALTLYRKAYPKDIVYILKLGDYKEINQRTIAAISQDFKEISGIFSVNCILRYLLFNKENYTSTYFSRMARLGTHSGLIGLGEHYNSQFINQTMSCVVFE